MRIRSIRPEFWTSEDIETRLVYSGPIPERLKDWPTGVMAHNTQHVYIFRDANAMPIYVGRTHNPVARWSRHKAKSAWWHDARSVELWLLTGPSRRSIDAAVCKAELWAIRTLNPTRNISGVLL